jgi:hypothetical protein
MPKLLSGGADPVTKSLRTVAEYVILYLPVFGTITASVVAFAFTPLFDEEFVKFTNVGVVLDIVNV